MKVLMLNGSPHSSGVNDLALREMEAVFKENGIEKLLVEEKGLNTYVKTSEATCKAAKLWWEKNSVYWEKVRSIWEEKIASLTTIKMETKVKDKVLHEYLMDQAKEYAAGKIQPAELAAKISVYIGMFLNTKKEVAVN